MKKINIVLFCVLCSAIFSGCGSGTIETSNDDNTVEVLESTETAVCEEVAETVALTEQELAQWTDYVNSRENNPFLLSYYEEPNQIDLHELFYTGCGLDVEELTEKEVQQYLEWTGADEIYTDMTRITGEQVTYVLKQRLGLTMEDMQYPLDWCYLEDSDVYLMQHGDTNVQSFVCIEGTKKGNQVVLDCFSEMTEKTCRVTLQLPEDSFLWMFVSNIDINRFISEEAYMEVQNRLGEENARQLCVFAENYEKWLPEEGATAGGTMGIAVYDLDKDGKLELMCALIQGTGLYAYNTFYQADVENGLVLELAQTATPEELAFEIEMIPTTEGWGSAYLDEQGRILYMSADYGKAGMESASCTEGYYYLENGKVMSEEIRAYVVEHYGDEDDIYTYYLPDVDTSVEKESWESAKQVFLNGKRELDVSICWKSLYEEEMREKKAPDWFLLLAESLYESV